MIVISALMLWAQIGADPASGSAAQCIGTPTEIQSLINPSFVARRYRIRNSCADQGGRIAVFLFCDGTNASMVYLTGGEEKIWSCYSSKENGTGPGILSIRTSWVR